MASKAQKDAAGKTASPFARLGLRTDIDLLLHLPLRYEDETRLTRIADLRPGVHALVQGAVARQEVVARGRRSLNVEIRDDSGSLTLRFIHYYGSQLRQFAEGRLIRAAGEVRGGLFGAEMVHPRYRVVRADEPLSRTLTPVYPSGAGVAQSALRGAIQDALDRVVLTETLPEATRQRLGLPSLTMALRELHRPSPEVSLAALDERRHPGWRRVVFDELLAQQLSLRRARAARAARPARPLTDDRRVRDLMRMLPFELTGAQRRAWADVAGDLARRQPMNRLVQGDVGSGKTVIAALAAARAIGSGRQVALMAPTEILAEQHLRKLGPWMEAIGVRTRWLAGSLKDSDKRRVREAVAAGEIDLLVGTHALIEDGVDFADLGLAIVDEQHRFGVAQRLALRDKRAPSARAGSDVPHQLMMSATPIPRTLAMTYYADLDVSVIDELPPGRRPIVTRLVGDARRDEVIERVRQAIEQGRQVYWVCPLIEESEALDLQTAIDTHVALSDALAPHAVGLVHGRMTAGDKQSVMQAFVGGELRILVATTVIEVGVDVPRASLMVIEHAERFGLAQLHQLRGRVGRGSEDSACVLMYRGPLSPAARERLKVMYETTDGFEIARRDLQLRGPGEFLGARQSGTAILRFADLERDADLAQAAVDVAIELERADPSAATAHLARWLADRQKFLAA